MANLGEAREKAFLNEAQERLNLFDDDVKLTQISRLRWISNLQDACRIRNESRTCILFTRDSTLANSAVLEFARLFHQEFFSQSEMQLIYANGERFEIKTDRILFDMGKRIGWKQKKIISMELLPSRDIFRNNRGSAESILWFQN